LAFLLATVRDDAVCRRLMTVRGVGPLVALTYRAPVDVLARFRRSKSVGAVFGLTPSRDQSGETDRPGRHIAVRGRDDADHALRSGPEHAGCIQQDGPTQGLGDEDPPASRHEKSDRRAGTPASSEGRGLAWSVTRRSYATRSAATEGSSRHRKDAGAYFLRVGRSPLCGFTMSSLSCSLLPRWAICADARLSVPA
jgi:Transposase IS116/IS110/IS902 family